MSKYMDQQVHLQMELKTRITDFFGSSRIFHRTASQMRQAWMDDIVRSKKWARCSRPVHEYLHGYKDAKYDELYAHYLAFAYEVNGKILVTTSDEYKALSPQKVSQESTWNGHVWKDDPTKKFSD